MKRRVEELNVAKITDSPVDRDTAQWLTQIDVTLAKRLAKVGLIPKRRQIICGEQSKEQEYRLRCEVLILIDFLLISSDRKQT